MQFMYVYMHISHILSAGHVTAYSHGVEQTVTHLSLTRSGDENCLRKLVLLH